MVRVTGGEAMHSNPFKMILRCMTGPSMQTDVAVSAEGIDTVVTFGVGTDSISIPLRINDDEVGHEAAEMYTVTFEILTLTDLVQPGMPMEAVINITDSDCKYTPQH
jgi:hypothetical protein